MAFWVIIIIISTCSIFFSIHFFYLLLEEDFSFFFNNKQLMHHSFIHKLNYNNNHMININWSIKVIFHIWIALWKTKQKNALHWKPRRVFYVHTQKFHKRKLKTVVFNWGEGGHKLQKGGFDFSPSKLNDYIWISFLMLKNYFLSFFSQSLNNLNEAKLNFGWE